MEYVTLAILLARLAIPLSIPRWPLWGAIASLLADTLDYIILDLTTGVPPNYQQMDKLLDTYYLSIAAIVSLKWTALARRLSIALFAHRFIGVILFVVTGAEALLLAFPNVFEYFYLFEAARQKFFPRFALTLKRALIVILIILLPTLLKEYLLHILKSNPWEWTKSNILLFLRTA